MGSLKGPNGKTMEQMMTNAISKESWEGLPKKHYNTKVMTKHKVLTTIYNAYKGYAKNSVIKEFGLYERGGHDAIMNFSMSPKERKKGLSSRGDY